MTYLNQIYKCNLCGNIVTILHEGGGDLICCGQPMELLEAKTEDKGYEKHVPVIDGNKVKIGSVEHPMEESHYIEWISASDGKTTARIFLKPKQKPEAEFCFTPIIARCYCNLHNLWKSK